MHKIQRAVALKYPKDAKAPFITAVAKGELAKRVLDIAKENQIDIIQNEELTDFLSVQEIGECVPETVWPVLAKIFAFVMQDL